MSKKDKYFWESAKRNNASYNYYYNGSQSFTATVSVSISGNRATITNNCDGGNTDSTIVGNLLYAG